MSTEHSVTNETITEEATTRESITDEITTGYSETQENIIQEVTTRETINASLVKKIHTDTLPYDISNFSCAVKNI